MLLSLACLACGLPQPAPAALVLDQIGSLSTAETYDFSTLPDPSPSQFFADFPDFSSVVLENFTVASGQLNVTGVSVVFRALGGFVDFANLQGFELNVFSDVGLASSGLSGDVANLILIAGSGATVSGITDSSGLHEYGLVSLTVDFDLPAEGEYWLGISAVGDHNTIGQFMVAASPNPPATAADARLANPGGGLGAGTLSMTGIHHAYSVTVVPEPAAASFVIIGACWCLSRRRRPEPAEEIF